MGASSVYCFLLSVVVLLFSSVCCFIVSHKWSVVSVVSCVTDCL